MFLQGGLSTILAVIMLAFSPFEFVIKYFFTIFLLVVGLGLINGIILLPVVLDVMGPTSGQRGM